MRNSTSSWPEAVVERARQLQTDLRPAIDEFLQSHQLPASFRQTIDRYYLPLALWLARRRVAGTPLVVGICGGQGSGKTTLTEFLQLVWNRGMQLSALGFSLDDLYLTRAERRQLAQQVHPLLATRGVPGTHDVDLGLNTITQLRGAAGDREVAIPLFDKSIDDRAPKADWPRWHGDLDILLFEGWCVGAKPWTDAEQPINTLERKEDPQGTWRNYVNAQLHGSYRQLFAQLDTLLMLKVPDMHCVLEWRTVQEQKLRARAGGGMSDGEIARFVQHYERITRNLLQEMPERADCVLELGRDHQVQALRLNN